MLRTIWPSVIILTLAAGSPVRADLIPWKLEVWAEGGGDSEHGMLYAPPWVYSHEGAGLQRLMAWGTDSGVYSFSIFQNDENLGPIGPEQGGFDLHVRVWDQRSEESGEISFHFDVSGWFDSWESHIDTAPGNQIQSLDVGGNRYSILIESVSVEGLGIPEGGIRYQEGVIGSEIRVQPINQMPEPSILVLLAGGGLIGGLGWWTRFRPSRSSRPAAARTAPPPSPST